MFYKIKDDATTREAFCADVHTSYGRRDDRLGWSFRACYRPNVYIYV